MLHETLPALFLAGDGSPRWLHPVYRCVSSLSVRQWTRTRLTDEKKDVFLLGGYIFSGLFDELKQQIIIVASGRQDIAERATEFSILGLYNTVYFAGGQFCTTSKLRVLNVLLDGTHFLASIEAMYLGVRPGIHPSIVYGIISNAAGRTFVELVPKLLSGDPLLIDFLNSASKNAVMALTTPFKKFSQDWLKNEDTDANLKRTYLISKICDLHEGMRFGFDPYAANNELRRYKQRSLYSIL